MIVKIIIVMILSILLGLFLPKSPKKNTIPSTVVTTMPAAEPTGTPPAEPTGSPTPAPAESGDPNEGESFTDF